MKKFLWKLLAIFILIFLSEMLVRHEAKYKADLESKNAETSTTPKPERQEPSHGQNP